MASQVLRSTEGAVIVEALIDEITAQRAYLSEIDGAIGDGDHGINMSKGFSACRDSLRARPTPPDLSEAFGDLSSSLLEGIGGSMGPLYGSFFMALSEAFEGMEKVSATEFGDGLAAGLEAVQDVGGARPGDKTLVDALSPAVAAFRGALFEGKDFSSALDVMVAAGEEGKESTRAMQARLGRASRLGERSIGVLDAGATSCSLILSALARSSKSLLFEP
jgi:dihydroxyacetone kinase-like protein